MAVSPHLLRSDAWERSQWPGPGPGTDWGNAESEPLARDIGITTQHWKDQTNREVCANQACGTKFTLFTRCHHCRRCGDVFCSECLTFKRRLNLLAHPDPNGRIYKVCESCYDKGPQTLGQTRSLLDVYRLHKGQRSHRFSQLTNGTGVSSSREKINWDAECLRLKQGFEASVQRSSVVRALTSLLPKAMVPEWQKAPFHIYGKMAQSCSVCAAPFTLTRTKRLCVVCGAAVCRGVDSSCSTSDLLVYIPDGCDKTLPLQAEIAVIKIVGCPSVEPALSEYLPVCSRCRQTLENRQVADYHHQVEALEASMTSLDTDLWSQLDRIDNKLRDIQNKVDAQLPQYQELIEALEVAPSSNIHGCTSKPDNRSNTQVLAKSQSDLGDHLTTVAMTIQSVRTLKPLNNAQATVIKNFLKAKCDYYHENMYMYRDLKRKLGTVTSEEMLFFIQSTVDKQAINSCYIAVRQLGLEALHLCTKHHLDDDVVTQLVALETVIEAALQRVLQSSQEPWDEHSRCVNELIQQQITTGNHRLIRVSSRRVQKSGPGYVSRVVVARTVHTLKRIYVQLCTKCADKSFADTKDTIRGVAEHLGKGESDWIKL